MTTKSWPKKVNIHRKCSASYIMSILKYYMQLQTMVEKSDYNRKITPELLQCNRRETKTVLIARFGMLDCGKNFKGTQRETCNECNVTDDESHRLNDCPKYSQLNFCNNTEKVDFLQIFSRDVRVLKEHIHYISKVWNVRNANGTMNSIE